MLLCVIHQVSDIADLDFVRSNLDRGIYFFLVSAAESLKTRVNKI